MININKAIIRTKSYDEATFQKGLALFQNNNIKNVSYSKSNKMYMISVKDNFDYQVVIRENSEDKGFTSSCNCTDNCYGLACKHQVAAMFGLMRVQDKMTSKIPNNENDKKVFGIINYFDNLSDIKVTKEIFHIELAIYIPQMLRKSQGNCYVQMFVGNKKMYKVQSFKRFLDDYVANQPIILGKDFAYNPGESAFDADSRKLLAFFLSIYDVSEFLAGTNPIFSRSQIVLTKYLLIKLLNVLNGQEFKLSLYGVNYENVRFADKNPQIEIDLADYDNSIVLDYGSKEPTIPITENGELLFKDNVIYSPNKKFLKYFLPFFSNLGPNSESLSFRGEAKNVFLEEILPKIHDILDIDIPTELSSRYIQPEFKCEIYLERVRRDIRAEIFFIYDDLRFNCFQKPKIEDDKILLRNKEKEEEVFFILEQYGFEEYEGFYLLKSDHGIYKFLTNVHNDLSAIADIYCSDNVKNFLPGGDVHKNKFRVQVKASSKSNLLELDIQYGDVSKEELREIFRSLKLKKKYYRLKDGDFVDLEEDADIIDMAQILEDNNISYNDIKEGEDIKISNAYSLLLNDQFKSKNIKADYSEEYQKIIDNVSNTNPMEYELPDTIEAQLKPYQETGFKWLCTLADYKLAGILADDMGLGKTLQAISYIAYMSKRDENLNFLIICPTSLAYNWQDEFENFAPSIPTIVISGTPEERKELIKNNYGKKILITTYPLIRRDLNNYLDYDFHTVFLDEAQFIKNYASINAISVKKIKAANRFALTGTPIENSLSELWSIFDFILPEYLFNHTKFVKKFEKPILKDDELCLERLNRRIHPFIMRRMKKDVLLELPEKYETKYLTEMTLEQEKIYLSYVASAKNELFEQIDRVGINNTQMQILAVLTRLRQICCHPSTFIEDYEGESGKLNLLLELLPDLISNHHYVVVFSSFTSMLDIAASKLEEMGISYFYMQGDTKVKERNKMVSEFNEHKADVFLISIKTGGTGLNLTGADTVIHFDPWWNPAVEEQATDRTHRIGQMNKVNVIKLITKNSIEEKIYKMQKQKKELSDSIVQTKEVFINKLTKEDLKNLLS